MFEDVLGQGGLDATIDSVKPQFNCQKCSLLSNSRATRQKSFQKITTDKGYPLLCFRDFCDNAKKSKKRLALSEVVGLSSLRNGPAKQRWGEMVLATGSNRMCPFPLVVDTRCRGVIGDKPISDSLSLSSSIKNLLMSIKRSSNILDKVGAELKSVGTFSLHAPGQKMFCSSDQWYSGSHSSVSSNLR